jgi:hypothetical protein
VRPKTTAGRLHVDKVWRLPANEKFRLNTSSKKKLPQIVIAVGFQQSANTSRPSYVHASFCLSTPACPLTFFPILFECRSHGYHNPKAKTPSQNSVCQSKRCGVQPCALASCCRSSLWSPRLGYQNTSTPTLAERQVLRSIRILPVQLYRIGCLQLRI